MFRLKDYERCVDDDSRIAFRLYVESDDCDCYDDALDFCKKIAGDLGIKKYELVFSWATPFEEIFPDAERKNKLWESVGQYLARHRANGALAALKMNENEHIINDDGVHIIFSEGYSNVFDFENGEAKIRKFLSELFTRPVKVTIGEKESRKKKTIELSDLSDARSVKVAFDEEAYKKEQEEFVKKNQNEKKAGKGGNANFNGKYIKERGAAHADNYNGATMGKKRRKLTPEEGEELPKDSKGNLILIGGEILTEPTRMDIIDNDIGSIAVRGRVFNFEEKQIPSGSFLITLYVTDNTYSIPCKFFIEDYDRPFVKKYFSPGSYLTLYGNVMYDTYSRETTLKVTNASTFRPAKRMDNAEKKRVELHLHTTLSQLDAITRPKDLMKRLAEWGHTAVAVTDHGAVQGYPEVFNAAGGDKATIKIIYGMECYLTDQLGEVTKEEAKNIPSWHCILLVKNLKGLRNLYELISKSNLNYFYKKPRIPRFELEAHREGLIIGSACSEGELYHAISHHEDEDKILKIASFYDYLEIQPTGNDMYLVREGVAANVKELENNTKKILELADKLGKLCVATCDVHFLDPEDAIYRCVMQTGQGFKDADEQPPIYLRTTEEMLKEFTFLGDRAYEVVVENTNIIADQIERIRPVPAGTFDPKIEGCEEEFRAISYAKAKATYGDPVPQHIMERLDKELNPIISHGYAVMYMAAQKLVAHSASNGYTVGSRGSVGSSLAAYMAGITEVNALPPHYRCEKCFYQEFFFNQEYEAGVDMPPKDCPNCHTPLIRDGFDIPFETFLGFNADKTPDIDLNFATIDQARAHKYCGVMFGDDHVFRAGTISGLAEKTARGYVLKYLETKGIQATEAEIQRLAAGFEGVKRTTGQHPGGIIVVPADHDILEFTPVQHPADQPDSDTVTTHFDYHFLHETILKLDILGHDGPEIIKCLQDFTGVTIDHVDVSDPRVMSLFTKPDELGIDEELMPIKLETGTLGIPEFGTRFAIGLLKSTQPTTVSELVRISGLSHGTDVWQGNASVLIEEGTATLKECICCRDDIMLYLIKMGLDKKMAFDIMEAVRKGKVAKKKEPKWDEVWRNELVAHNVPEWYIKSCEKIQYMFPRAHAVAYVLLSVRMAWYKLYYPLAYYATRFTLKVDEFDGVNMLHGIDTAYLKMQEIEKIPKKTAKEEGQITIYEQLMEMYARHIEFLPVDLYKSEAKRFVPEDGKLRPPFCALAGVGVNAAEAIVAARNDGLGEFECVEDVVTRAKVNKTVIETLREEGVFDGMPETNDLTLFN